MFLSWHMNTQRDQSVSLSDYKKNVNIFVAICTIESVDCDLDHDEGSMDESKGEGTHNGFVDLISICRHTYWWS